MEMDWVKRKAIGEQFVEEQKAQIWQSLCASLQSATNSFSVHYGGVASGRVENDHQFCISVQAHPPYEAGVIEVTFMPPEVRVVCTMGHCRASTFVLNPNKDAPFRNKNKEQLTSDQLSEAILRCVFFPAETRGVHTPIVSPCSS